MRERFGITLAIVLVLLAGGGSARAASPDATVPDAWVLDASGRVSGAYNVGGVGWTESAAESGAVIDVGISGGGTAQVTADFGQDSVIVNETPMSYPNTAAGRPPFSIVGLGDVLGDPTNANRAAIQVDLRTASGPLANPDTTNETVQVLLQALPRPSNEGDLTNLTIRWRINGAPTTSKDASIDPTHTFYLAENGVYVLEASARQGGGGTSSGNTVWTVTIAGADPSRDGDGDGLPDVFEAEFGFSPVDTDLDQDLDANGVPDFIEIVCDTGLGFPNAKLDTDLDEKTDCEETLRGTNLFDTQLHFPDRPVTGDFYQVELLLDGQVFADDAQTTPETSLTRVLVASAGGSLEYDTDSILNDFELAALVPPITQLQLPVYLQNDLIKLDLVAGDIPDQARVSASQSLVVIAYESIGGSSGEKWVARGWIDAEPELTPTVVTPILVAGTPTWTTGTEWLTDYVNYLLANIVKNHVINLSPTTGLGVSLLESAAAYYAQLSEGATILFGDPDSSDTPDAVRSIQLAIGRKIDDTNGAVISPGRTLADFHTELLGLAQPGELAAPFAATVAGYYADTSTFTQRDTLRAAAALLQGDPSDDDAVARYIPRLLVRMTLAELEALPQSEYDALVDPLGDADGDGVSNRDELEAPPPVGSDPLLADTDGDGYTDDYDPCPASAANTCLSVAYQTMDSDGDGVVDAIDNCMNLANPDQIDANNDNLGDACPRYAAIRTPSSNLRVFAGTAIDFTSSDGAALLFQPPLVYAWDFDGAAAGSALADPGLITFGSPGDYDVSFVVTEDGGAGQSTPADVRTIIVVAAAPPPIADAGGAYFGIEGSPILFAGSATPGSGVISDYDWTFGEGGIATGSTPSHVYASEGQYSVTLTVRDTGNNQGSDVTAAVAWDSVPQVAFTATPQSGVAPFQVAFADVSTAYDGIATRSWVWSDGKPNGAGVSPSHVFTSPGTYQVELHVTDTDGSLSIGMQTVTVIGAVPTTGQYGTVLLVLLLALAGAGASTRLQGRSRASSSR